MSANNVALEPEWSILLAACCSRISGEYSSQLKSLLQAPVRWDVLFSLSERHGLQPLLFQALQAFAETVPSKEMQVLGNTYQTNLHKALLLSSELVRITQHVSELDIEVLSYKGVALAESLYGDIALRQAGDIDLLVRSRHLPRVSEALAKIGYTAHCNFSKAEEKAYRRSGYEYVFDGPAGRNILEVQWAFQPRFYAVDFNLDAIFGRAIPISVAGKPLRTPSHADQILTLSVHAAKHVWGRLVWLCDIARLMSGPGMDWSWVLCNAQALGISRILAVSMLLASRLLRAETSSTVRKFLLADRSAVHLADEVQTYISSEGAFSVESISYFRLMARLRERPIDRARFFSRLALTPGPSEWQTVRLPFPLFPLYRLIRISRLAGKMVKVGSIM